MFSYSHGDEQFWSVQNKSSPVDGFGLAESPLSSPFRQLVTATVVRWTCDTSFVKLAPVVKRKA